MPFLADDEAEDEVDPWSIIQLEDDGLQRLGRVRIAVKMLSLVLVEAPEFLAASIHRHS